MVDGHALNAKWDINPWMTGSHWEGERGATFFKKIIIFFWLFKAAPMAYGGSQAGGQIGAIAAGLHHSHSNTRSKPCL